MIKKINQIIEDMPIIIKVIVGIILCFLSAAIMLFINIAKVSAATYTYDMNGCSSFEKDNNNPNGHFVGHGYATNGTCTVTNNDSNNMLSAFDGWFENYISGVGTGYITVEMNSLNNNMTCNSLRNNLRIKVGGNDIVNSSTGWTCSQQLFKTTFTQSFSLNVPVTQNALDIIVSSTNWTNWSNYTMTGQVTIEEQKSITNEDLNNTAMGIINQAIANALDIINNATDNRNAITTMLQTLTNSIYGNVVEAINNTNKICDKYENEPLKENIKGILNSDGSINSNTGTQWSVTNYIYVQKNQTYIYKRNNTNNQRYCLYDINKDLINCQLYGNGTSINITPTQDGYIKITYNNTMTNTLSGKYCQSKEEWQNKQDENRTSKILSDIVKNATDQINQSVSNSGNIITAINSSASNIISNIQEKVKNALESTNMICNDETKNLADKISNWNRGLDINGNIVTQNDTGVTDFIKLSKGRTYTYNRNFTGGNIKYCLYDMNKTLKECYEIPANDQTVSLLNNNDDQFVRFMVTEPTGGFTQTLSGVFCTTVTEIQEKAVAEIRETTDSIINSFRDTESTCMHLNWKMLADYERQGKYLNASGQFVSNSHYNVYGKYPLYRSIYHLKYNNKYNYVNNAHYCLYDVNQNLINCINISTNTSEFTIDNSNQDYYFISVSVPNGGEEFDTDGSGSNTTAVLWSNYCSTTPGINAVVGDLSLWQKQRAWTIYDEEEADQEFGLQSIWNQLKGIGGNIGGIFNSFVTDPSTTLSNLNNDFNSNNSISQLLLLPVTMLQAFNNGFNDICSDFVIGDLYNTTLKFKCINLQALLGNGIWYFYDVVITGLFILVIRKKMVDIFYNIFSLRMERNELE